MVWLSSLTWAYAKWATGTTPRAAKKPSSFILTGGYAHKDGAKFVPMNNIVVNTTTHLPQPQTARACIG